MNVVNDAYAVLLGLHDCVQSRQGRMSPDVFGIAAEGNGTLRGRPRAPKADVSDQGLRNWALVQLARLDWMSRLEPEGICKVLIESGGC